MYRKTDPQMEFEDFILPFPGKLSSNNRWVKLAKIIPWEELEDRYSEPFSHTGNPAKSVRIALGALIIKEKCGFSDEETVQQIMENPYLQYFIGFKEFQKEPPFASSLMVFFRKRLTPEILEQINELICLAKDSMRKPKPPLSGGGGKKAKPQKAPDRGKLLLDATCAPADIRYPTDLSLLNEAREKLDDFIDTLSRPLPGRRPRTYRRKARTAYLNLAKQKKPRIQTMRKAVGKQLRFVERNLRIIGKLDSKSGVGQLNSRQLKILSTIRTLYAQQKTMYEERSHSAADRIVSLHQPYVRPIVRGKAQGYAEFGAKVAISLVGGYVFLERLSWDAFNEGGGFKQAVERYRRRYGCNPQSVLADKIYRTRENLKYCRENGVRLSGRQLGRRSGDQKKEERRLERLDNRERNAVEGKFGEGKRKYGLGRVMARLQDTSASVIALKFLVMNLENRLRVLFISFWENRFWEILNPRGKFMSDFAEVGC